MSTAYVLGYAVGVMAALSAALICYIIYKKNHPESCKYDERQELMRGKAFKYAFFTQLAYNCVMMVMNPILPLWADYSMQIFIGVIFSAFVYAVICIRNDAYISFREKPRVYITMFLAVGAVNVFITVMNLTIGTPYVQDGMLTFRAANPICAILLITLAIVLAVKAGREKRNDAEREELE